jgi:prevent-host-death family protein
MKVATATEAKNRFGHLIDMAMTEPVAIDKNGRQVAVLLSIAEYQRLTELEERTWGEKALKALQNGFLSEGESSVWLEGKLNAETAAK